MRKALFVLLLAAGLTGCASSSLKNAYNTEASLVAVYKVAAPMRAEMCKVNPRLVSVDICATGEKVLKADYVLIVEYGKVLSQYLSTRDQALERQILALIPSLQEATVEIARLIAELKR